jgi:ATP-dependent RNA helicase SUPV3L1/SUV3
LRLVLWSLSKGLQDFPEAPPPGLVTVPTTQGLEAGAWAMSGYRAAGERAIRIDMLERLADMLRDQNTRAGFEATPDMLSITGMTLEQFADLMGGLGYKAEKGEREKVRAAVQTKEPVSAPVDTIIDKTAPAVAQDVAPVGSLDGVSDDPALVPTDVPVETTPETLLETTPETTPESPVDTLAEVPETIADAPVPQKTSADPVEMEVFYTFAWAPKRPASRPQSDKPQRKGPPKGKRGAKPSQGNKTQSFSARPPKKEKPIDPDNPFAAALAGLKRD